MCLSGDFDYDETIRLINKYWGGFERKEDPTFEVIKEASIVEPVFREVNGPEAESLFIGFRFEGAKTKDATMLTMVDMVLSNSAAGLIDLNLNQAQELIGGGCFPYVLKDYSMHGFYGSPKQDQSLEEVKDLLLSQIEEVKKGNFEAMGEWIKTNIHQQGRKKGTFESVKDITGKELGSSALLKHLERRYLSDKR